MKKQQFEVMNTRVEKDIREICKENRDGAVYVVIGAVTSMAGTLSERNFSESQLAELFALADSYNGTHPEKPGEVIPDIGGETNLKEVEDSEIASKE